MKINQNDLTQRVKNLLGEMSNILQQQTDGRQLIKIAEDILNFLFVLKLQNKTVNLDQNQLGLMITQLSNMQFGGGRDAQARKEHSSNFLHNLQYFNFIKDMNLFDPIPFFRSKWKVISYNQVQFVKAEVGLVNAGATCYMNATLQAFLQDPDFRDSFRYGEAKIQYDNRLTNLLNHYVSNGLLDPNLVTNNFQQDYNYLQNLVITQRLKFLAGKATYDNQGNADWSGAPDWAITEMELILKCFANADVEHNIFNPNQNDFFYKSLENCFGPNCKNLPPKAIDMSYELFLLSNQVDSIVKTTENGGQVHMFFKPQRFKDFMSVKNPLFLGIQPNDAKDLVNFLIMTWHEEQNKVKLQQNQDPVKIADNINYLARQVNQCVYNMQYNYNMCQIAMSNNNLQAADYWLSGVYYCKNFIQPHISNIIQYADMIKNLDKDNKYQTNVNKIITMAQNLSVALGGYSGINDFKSNFNDMFECTSNIVSGANDISNNQTMVDQTNAQAVFTEFATNFTKHNQSAVSDRFYAMNLSITQCGACNIKLYNYQIYYFLIFPLEEVRKHNADKRSINSNTVTLHDCFEFEKKENVMSGSNEMYCNNCKQNHTSKMQQTLVTVPKNLVLLFNRGRGIEFNVGINYPKFFDQHDIGESFLDSDQKYTIKHAYSTIKHSGENGSGGHFFMDGISERDGSLNRYNDGGIQEVDENGMPYLVFYKDMQPDEMLNCVLKKVSTDKNLNNNLEAIAVKFSELGQLDIEKTNNNESRRLRFAYLLMQAMLPNLTQNKTKYKLLDDNKARNLILAIFNLIKDEKDFSNNAMENYRVAIQSEKEAIIINDEDVNIAKTTRNMKQLFNDKMGIQGNNVMNNNVNENNNNFNNDIIQQNMNNQNNINNNNNNFNGNNNIVINNQNNNSRNNINSGYNSDMMQEFDLLINPPVNRNIISNRNLNLEKYPKYNPASKNKFSWLKFVLAAIFASGAIVAVIFEFYILAAIALAAAIFTLFGKLIFSRCFGCCRSQNYNSVPMNEDSQRISQYYGQNCPNLENQYDQYENK